MRGVPEFSLDGWDLLTRGLLSDVPRPQPFPNRPATRELQDVCVCGGNSA